MNRLPNIARLLVMALVAVTLVSVATPICAMPDCDDVAAGTCADFLPACDDCPESVVMKHTHDDAVSVVLFGLDAPIAVATVTALPAPAAIADADAPPEATASPPPLDPLGVRLTV